MPIRIKIEKFAEYDNEIMYTLIYNGEWYSIFVKRDGEFHNKMYECDREIPEELSKLVDFAIRSELKGW